MHDGKSQMHKPLIRLFPVGDLVGQIASDDKNEISVRPTSGGSFQGDAGERTAELLDQLEVWVVDLHHHGFEQFGSKCQGGAVLLDRVVTGPSGNVGVTGQEAIQKCLMPMGGGISAGAE